MPFGGVFSVLPTPFSASGDVDLDSLRRIVDLFIADGVDGFTALGVTSEVARLTDAERDRVLETILAHVGGRLPVVAGTTADGLRSCIEYTRRAKAAGAEAVMISRRAWRRSIHMRSRSISPRSRQPSTFRSSCRTIHLLEELMAGAAGAMTGFAFPAILVKVVSLFRAGDVYEAAREFYAKVHTSYL